MHDHNQPTGGPHRIEPTAIPWVPHREICVHRCKGDDRHDWRTFHASGSGPENASPVPENGSERQPYGDPERRVVVLVEDEWMVRLDMADALDASGWLVVEASSGEEALTLLDEERQIDLLITDIRLAGLITGWDVAEAFRVACPQIGVIYVTANPTIEARRVSRSVFLAKPLRNEEMVALSDRLWREVQLK